MKILISLVVTLVTVPLARPQFAKWEATGILGALPPVSLDRSPIVGTIRNRLAALQLKEAGQLAESLTREHAATDEGYFWLGFVELQQKRLYAAAISLRQAEKLKPPGNATQKVLGMVYLELGQHTLFEMKMKEAIALDETDFAPHYSLARYLQSQKEDLEGSVAQYRQVLERSPDHYESLYYLGLASEVTGKPAQAKTFYEEAIAASEHKSQPFGLPYEGLSRLNRAEKPELSLQYARQAVSIEPKSPDHQLELARVYSDLGRWPEAAEAFKAAVVLDPARSSSYYHLFVTYQHLGDRGAAQLALADFQRASACYGKE